MDAQCAGKTKYRSKAAALNRIEMQQRRKKGHSPRCGSMWAGRELGTYRCPACGWWHVGGTVMDHGKPKVRMRSEIVGLEMLPASAVAKWGRA